MYQKTDQDRSPWKCGGNDGVILLVVVTVIAALTIMGGLVMTLLLVDLRGVRYYKGSVEALHHADAGAMYVLGRIQEDITANSLTLDQPVESVSYAAPSWLTFDTVTTLTRLADNKSYRYDVRGRSGNSLGRTEIVIQTPGNVIGVNPNAFGLFSDGNLEIDSGTFVTADAASNSDILVKSGSGVTGDAIPGPSDSTTVESGSWVTGSTTPMSEEVILPPIDPDLLADAQANNNNASIPGQFMSGNDFEVDSDTCTLDAGTYYFDTIYLKSGARVNVNGPVVIFCTDWIDIESNSEFNNGGDPDELWMFTTTSGQISIESSSFVYGHIYAPNCSDFDVSSNSGMVGSMTGGGDGYIRSNSTFVLGGSLNGLASGLGADVFRVALTSWKTY